MGKKVNLFQTSTAYSTAFVRSFGEKLSEIAFGIKELDSIASISGYFMLSEKDLLSCGIKTKETINLIKILIKNKRLKLLPTIVKYAKKEYLKVSNVQNILIKTTSEDESLIDGGIVNVGGLQIDFSLKTKLAKIKSILNEI